MISSYNYYKQIESPNMYLCNPDRRFICALNGENRHLTLRFNDLSELTFTVPKIKESETYYNLIETKRLVFVEKIGWFQIIDVSETIEGDCSSKEVSLRSHQYSLKDRGFVTEERVYMFYNPNDWNDANYTELSIRSLSDENAKTEYKRAIPSVVGQLNRQLGIKVALQSYETEPSVDYGDWTIIYIDPILKFQSKNYGEMYVPAENIDNICRGFKADTNSNGYDFIINQVEKAFEVVFEFDFLHHTIKVKTLNDITKPTNIYLAFDNLVNSLNVKENAEDIVTVMSCNGSDIDIRTVNPMGTNYIANFNYYKRRKSDDGKIEYPWMSKELIGALDNWEIEFEKWQHNDETRVGHTKSYSKLVEELQELYTQKTQLDEDIQYSNLKLKDLQVARDQYINGDDKTLDGEGYVTAETVKVNSKSLLEVSRFDNTDFTDAATIVGHTSAPKPTKNDDGHYTFSFGDDVGTNGTPKSLIQNFVDSKGNEDDAGTSWYFMDDDNKSYCKLTVESEVGVVKDTEGMIATNGTAEVRGVLFNIEYAGGLFSIEFPDGTSTSASQSNSYFIYDGARYRVLASADNVISVYAFYVSGFDRYTTYAETAGDGWCKIWENYINNNLAVESQRLNADIAVIETEMKYIQNQCNIQLFVKNASETLYDELLHYWIEGDYSNDNIAAYDETTMAERIALAQELMAAGKVDLEKCSQPQFEMTVDAINFIKMYEFRQFTNELVLGRTVTIEKNEEVLFYPALMTIEYDLDDAETFSMTFSNASKPSDTAMTFADLIKESSSTSRTVSANWSNLTDYSRNKEQITNLIEAPLDRTLRAAQANMAAQAFIIDDTGILGRKYDTDFDEARGVFLPEQVRIINNTILFTDDNWETAKTALGRIELEDGASSYGLIAETIVGRLVLGENLLITGGNENSGLVNITGGGIEIKDSNQQTVFMATSTGELIIRNYATNEDVNDKITESETRFEVSANAIKQSVTDLTKTIDTLDETVDGLGININDLKTRVSAAETSITQNANAIILKANQTTVDTLGSVVDTHTSTLQTQATQIAAKVSKTGGDDAFGWTLESDAFSLTSNNDIVFRCDQNGIFVKGNGEFTGEIHATVGGTIGAFSITQDGLESDYIKLNSREIRFPIQSSFNLNDEVSIYTSEASGENTSYITTVNSSNFVIQNLSGAGIKFSKDKENVTQNISMTVYGPDLSSAGNMGSALTWNSARCTFNYSATLSAQLPYPCTRTAYIRYVYMYSLRGTEYRTKQISLSFAPFTTYTTGSVELDAVNEVSTRYNPSDGRFETGIYFSDYVRTNQSSVSVVSYSTTNNTLYSLGNFSPETNQIYSLGANDRAWGNLYLYSGTQVGSDKRLKNSIEKIPDDYDMFFDGLIPVSYILNNGTSHRRHIGFIAQDVEDSLNVAGIDTKDFAGLCIPSQDEKYYMLRYEEFIALNTSQIQRLKSKVNELEKKVISLQETISKNAWK